MLWFRPNTYAFFLLGNTPKSHAPCKILVAVSSRVLQCCSTLIMEWKRTLPVLINLSLIIKIIKCSDSSFLQCWGADLTARFLCHDIFVELNKHNTHEGQIHTLTGWGGCVSGGIACCPQIAALVVRSPAPPVHMSKSKFADTHSHSRHSIFPNITNSSHSQASTLPSNELTLHHLLITHQTRSNQWVFLCFFT